MFIFFQKLEKKCLMTSKFHKFYLLLRYLILESKIRPIFPPHPVLFNNCHPLSASVFNRPTDVSAAIIYYSKISQTSQKFVKSIDFNGLY
jgi:hypothetical protein